MRMLTLYVVLFVVCASAAARDVVFEGKAGDRSQAAAWYNGALMNTTLAQLKPGDCLIVPQGQTFYMMGGIVGKNLRSVTLQFDGTVVFSDDIDNWPTLNAAGRVMECFEFMNITKVTFTSKAAGGGLIDGSGARWWGIPFIGYALRGENRPRLINIGGSKDVLFENIMLKNSPYWTFWAHDIDGLEVRNSHISARRDDWDGHDLDDLSAFNTDGFDVAGRNVWIHDVSIWNQDDCIAVKDASPSENMLFERINASGLGLTIGSIGGSVVRNITFRDCYMHHTYKGIYLKFRADGGSISDVLYENIVMDEPEQWPIWIGPAQQSDSTDICAAHPCSLCWPEIPFSECNAPANGIYANITLRNITINNPLQSPGVIMGSAVHPMTNILFDNVVVKNPPPDGHWGKEFYKCEGVGSGIATGTTFPVPPCFKAAR